MPYAVAAAAITVVGSNIAADKQAAALKKGRGEEARQFNLIFESLAPYRELGENAVPLYNAMLGLDDQGNYNPELAQRTLESTPGFQQGLETGIGAVETGQAAKSNLLSGRAAKELFRFGSDYQSQKRDEELNRITNAINIGRGANTESNTARQRFGERQAGYSVEAGNVQAQNVANITNAISGGISGYQQNNPPTG